MIIHCIFARYNSTEMPTIEHAWDEYLMEDDPKGYYDELERVRRSGVEFREIQFEVPEGAILRQFNTPKIPVMGIKENE